MTDCLKISLITIFPKLFENFLSESLIGRSVERGLLSVKTLNLRDFSEPPHHRVDDTPYGGGAGMVMRAEIVCKAVEKAKQDNPQAQVILLSASGKRFDQDKAKALSVEDGLILLCGRYEGVDQRAVELCVDEEICLGDFVLMGGEVAAMALIEAVSRLRPGVLGNEDSTTHESFSLVDGNDILIEAPQYTKPDQVRGLKVPDVLLSGNHAAISEWRQQESKKRTRAVRPDLLGSKQK